MIQHFNAYQACLIMWIWLDGMHDLKVKYNQGKVSLPCSNLHRGMSNFDWLGEQVS